LERLVLQEILCNFEQSFTEIALYWRRITDIIDWNTEHRRNMLCLF
jgi:hypothetical protein